MRSDFNKTLEMFEGNEPYEIRSGIDATQLILTECNITYIFNKDGSFKYIFNTK